MDGSRTCYLDNSATTRPFDVVMDTMVHTMADLYYNPSAAYGPALEVEDRLTQARATVLEALGGGGSLVFTSGGTEADNLALFGVASLRKGPIIIGSAEHAAISQSGVRLGKDHKVIELPVNHEGMLSPDELAEAVTEQTVLVSIQHVNNEIGSVQDIVALCAAAKRKNPAVVFHSDGVQAFLRVPVGCTDAGIDLYSVSAHKVHGPKGVGALFMGKGVRLSPGLYGGGQEQGVRSGTENVPGILGFAKAVELYRARQSQYNAHLMEMKLKLAQRLTQIEGAVINGPQPQNGAPHILNLSFERIKGEVLLRALSDQGIYVSMGSACSARLGQSSQTLAAIGAESWQVKGAIRLSLSPLNTMEDIDRACEAIQTQVKRLRTFVRR